MLVDDVRDVAGCRCVTSWTSWILFGVICRGRIIGLVVRWLYPAVLVIGHVECTGGSGSEVVLVWRVVEVESSEGGGEDVEV